MRDAILMLRVMSFVVEYGISSKLFPTKIDPFPAPKFFISISGTGPTNYQIGPK